jgi:hypothetical protein
MRQFLTILILIVLCIFSVYVILPKDECVVLRTVNTDDGIIEVVNPSCKEGLPHTTGSNTIRMTEAALHDPRAASTLVHERVHLDQKRNRSSWYEFYKTAWEYTLMTTPPPGLPYKYQYDLRPNPDTSDAPWAIWRSRYLFFPNYSPQRTLKGAVVQVYDLQDRKLVEPPSEWRAAFCSGTQCPHQFEHPHELAAEYIALQMKTPASAKLFAWIH